MIKRLTAPQAQNYKARQSEQVIIKNSLGGKQQIKLNAGDRLVSQHNRVVVKRR